MNFFCRNAGAFVLGIAPFAAWTAVDPASLKLTPGMQLAWGLANTRNAGGEVMGDYDFYATVTSTDGAGFTFEWVITVEGWRKGVRTVKDHDARLSRSFTNWYYSGERGTKSPCTSLVFSERAFRELRAGTAVDATCPTDVEGVPSYTRLELLGKAAFTATVDGEEVYLPVLRIRNHGFGGGEVWVLDNAKFPLVVKQEDEYANMALISIRHSANPEQVAEALENTGTAVTNHIYFLTDSDQITPDSQSILSAVAEYLRRNPEVKLAIEGHTDNIGGAEYNLSLSLRRANSVKRFLVEREGISADRLAAAGAGLEHPVADNASPEGRARNRRVVFRRITN